jgi:hypothetical protein
VTHCARPGAPQLCCGQSAYPLGCEMRFRSEAELENYIRKLIANHIAKKNNIYALESKKAVDIIICRNCKKPALFFIEVKYYRTAHGRLPLGSGKGCGFQPELLSLRPKYFEKHLRWIMASKEYPNKGVLFLDSKTVGKYIAGRQVGKKFNNIQKRIFCELDGYKEEQLVAELKKWLRST